jgi:integrase
MTTIGPPQLGHTHVGCFVTWVASEGGSRWMFGPTRVSQSGSNEARRRFAIKPKNRIRTNPQRKLRLQTAASLKLRLVTAQRGGEIMSMEWSEINEDWWTIPEGKSKNGLEHRVPLSPLAMRIIAQMRSLTEKNQTNMYSPVPKATVTLRMSKRQSSRSEKRPGQNS